MVRPDPQHRVDENLSSAEAAELAEMGFSNIHFDEGPYSELDVDFERAAALTYSKEINGETVRIIELYGDIRDNFNANIDIKLSNGDVLEYSIREVRRSPTPGTWTVPPFYVMDLTINREQVIKIDPHEDFDASCTVDYIMQVYEKAKGAKPTDEHAQRMSSSTGTVPADSFTQQITPNHDPTQIDTHIGGIPNHWLASQPISRRDMKMNNTPIAEGKPRDSRVMKFTKFVESIIGSNK